jgi:superfamily I DNA and/or RNA helicase
MDIQAYFNAVLSALQEEQKEEEQFFVQEIQKLSFQERKNKGLLWYPAVLKNEDFHQTEGILATFEKTNSEIYPNGFQSGQLATLVLPNQNTPIQFVGTVTRVLDTNITLHFDTDELPEWVYEGKIGIQQYYDEQNYLKMKRAIENTLKAPPNSNLAHIRDVITQNKTPLPHQDFSYLMLPELNASQQKAIQSALACQDIHIIHGPPGTGKTTTLVHLIAQLVKTEKQILVTAASNAAVDNIAERLTQKGISVLRIGHPARVNENLHSTLMDYQIQVHAEFKLAKNMLKEADNIRKQALKFKRNFGTAEREQRQNLLKEAKNIKKEVSEIEKHIKNTLLQQTQVICTTLIGCYHPDIAHKTYSTVVIDEATQAIEPATWIPITQAKRVILAGDHHQLPPTVKSLKAAKMGLHNTLFEKTHTAYPQNSTMLSVQYRMHADIAQFSNEQFYENKIENAPAVATQTLVKEVSDLYTLKNKPIVFIDTAGCGYEEVYDEQSKSLYNPQEAVLLEKIYSQLVQNLNTKINIAVISPYSAQVQYLKNLIPRSIHTETDTIDSFQGREKDAIFISLVRSNNTHEIGFLADTRRMNVALTRAKKHLVVIGDSATISSHSFYNQFLEYIHSIDAYQSAWEWI